ncbi:hypothetical protein DRE_03973 [Drechslerella stenobrocha 248]|uniref:DUF1479 domain protein n=1 Tax=Drechslerella stenobrocha 248 TaxID=1043628 RepID=W7I3G5_9PEZI|nr:hypothetical protein DRE_03973 [Drechslerella stenobrocha 248]
MVEGLVQQWPAWNEYGRYGDSSADSDARDAKKAVIDAYGAENLKKGWIRVCEQLKTITDEISAQGSKAIPVFKATDILQNGFSDDQRRQIKKHGCVVIQGVIPHADAEAAFTELNTFLQANKSKIRAWPDDSPSMYELFDSPMQNTIRSHPDHLKLQRLLNALWHDKTGETSPDPLIYYDGVRNRPPNQAFLGLGPHIDAGSLSRWADPSYRKVYDAIFSGRPEDHDAWDLGVRKDAVQDMFKAQAHSSVFRAFQGWTALTPARAREGSILLYPNVQATIAYLLLRPFFRAPESEADILDATKWTFDESGCFFPGTDKKESQFLSRTSHPHLQLEECLVHAPEVQPGDTLWWHSDLCHAVDPEHRGTQNSSVFFIAACPTTAMTSKYIKRQLADALAGRQPFDSRGKVNETLLKGYKGHEGIGEEARKAFGYYL